MARPKFNPTADQKRILNALTRVADKRVRLDAEADRLIAEAEGADIPIAIIAEAVRTTRKTVYRHLGRNM